MVLNVKMTQNHRNHMNIWRNSFLYIFFTNTFDLKILGKCVEHSHFSPQSPPTHQQHVYMRPKVNSDRFEISNRFEMFHFHGNLRGDFTAATSQTIAKLFHMYKWYLLINANLMQNRFCDTDCFLNNSKAHAH